MTQAIQLNERNIETLLSGDQTRIEQLVNQTLTVTVADLAPQELLNKAWHWVRDLETGKELILWIPYINDDGNVFTLDPDKPGSVPEILAEHAELLDRAPLDVSHQTTLEVFEHEA